MLQGRFLSVSEARDVQEFRKQVISFGRSLGFETVNALAVLDHSLSHTAFYGVDNTPLAYTQSYNNSNLWPYDPVMQHCKSTSIPIVWDQETYVSKGQGALWEDQAQFGYKTGIALALHLPEDRHFFMGLDRDRALSVPSKKLTQIVADLQLFAVHAQDAAFRIFAPQAVERPDGPTLTPRELEVLRWTMDGKLAWEVADALNISERTAVFHLRNAAKKLGCVSKYQAVLKALRLGLLA